MLINTVKPVVKHRVAINRNRVSQTDGLVDIEIDGMIYTTSGATDLLICDGPYYNVKKFMYYMWSCEGIFRHGTGTFRWYFLLNGDNPEHMFPRIIETTFREAIDFEHDTKDEIFRKLSERLQDIRQAILNYNGNPELKDVEIDRKIYEQVLHGEL